MPTATGTGLSFNNITLGSTQPESGFGASVMPRPATGQFSYTWEESGKLGMSLNHRERAPYVMLSKVSDVQRQNALAASGVEPGMVITKVGVQSVATADYPAVMNIIKDASRPLTIWFADEATANSIADQAEQGTAPTTRSPLSQRSEWQETVSVEEIESEVCTNVFLDVNPSGAASKRIEIELFDCVTPRTAENFRRLCVGDKMNMTQRKPLSYQRSVFHHVVPGKVVIGGDITSHDGNGGESIYGLRFNDENFDIGHSEAGLLSMVSKGPNTNNSQFCIHLAPAPELNGHQVPAMLWLHRAVGFHNMRNTAHANMH